MAGNLLLSRLSDGNFSNIAEDVQDYLNPVYSQELEIAALHTYGLFAVKFLHGSVKFLDKPNPEHVTAIHTAYQSFLSTRSHVQLSEPCFLLKVLYHIFMKLSQNEDLVDCLSVSHYILEEVGFKACSDKSISNIVIGVAQALWKKASLIETREKIPCMITALKLRHVALKFMAAQKKPLDGMIDKIFPVLIRFEKFSSKCKPNSVGSNKECLLSSVCDDMCNVLTDIYDDASDSVVLIRLQQFKYLYGRGQVKRADDILLSLRSYCGKDDSGPLSTILNLCKACLSVSNLKESLESNETKLKVKAMSESLADILLQYEDNLANAEETFRESQSEELKSMMMLMVSSFTTVVKSLLSCSWPSKELEVETLMTLISISKAQSRINATCCQCEFTKVQQTWGWRILPNKTLSSLYLLQLQCLHSISLKKGNIDKNLLTQASETIEQFERHLAKLMTEKTPDKLTMFDKDCLGTMAQKFGIFCYNNGDDERAVGFYETACKHHTECCQEENHTSSNRAQEVNLWRCYDSLAESYRRLGRHKEAMNTLTKCMTVDSSHVMSAVKLWVKVKRDLVKLGQIEDDILIMSLCDSVEKSDFKVDKKIALLEAEVKMYQTYRSVMKLHGAELKCLLDLQSLVRVPQKRVSLLIEEAKLLWLNPSLSSHRNTLECVKEAIEVSCVEEKGMGPMMAATLAEAHLWLYICQTEQLSKETSAGLRESPKASEEPDNTDDNGEDKPTVKTKIKSPCVTLRAENKLLATLDTALSLWGRCVEDNKLHEQLDISTITQSLEITAAIYCSVEKPIKGLQALQLLKKFKTANITTGLSPLTKLFLVRLWSDIDVPSEISHILQVWDDSSDQHYSLLKAEYELRMGQLENCGKIAIDLLTRVRSAAHRTRESCLLEGCAQRLLSKLCIITCGSVTEPLRETASPLHLAQEGVSCHLSVLYHLLGKHLDESLAAKVAGPVDRWLVITEILHSLLHLGRTYLLIGYARGATCYLEEGLKLSQSLALPRWCGYFLSELGQLSSISGSVTDTRVYLQQVKDILCSKDDLTTLPDMDTLKSQTEITADCPTATPATTKPTQSKQKSSSCFGFGSPYVEEEEFVLRTVPMVTRDRLSSENSDFETFSLESMSVHQSCLLQHASECVCLSCADLTSHRIQTAHLITISEHYLANGYNNHALDTLQLLQKILVKLGSTLNTLIKPLCSAETKKSLKSVTLNKDSSEKTFMWLSVIIARVLCGISKVHLSQGEINLAMTTLQKAEDSLCGFPEKLSEILHLYSEIQLCKASTIITATRGPGKPLSHKHLDVSLPVVGNSSIAVSTKGKTFPGNTEALVKNLENLILHDGKHKDETLKDLTAKKTQRGKKNKINSKSICVLNSDEEVSDTNKERKQKVVRKTKMSKTETFIIAESDAEDVDLSSDICERLIDLSIHAPSKSERRSNSNEMSVTDKISYAGRKKMSNNENTKANNLLPKATRRGKLKDGEDTSVNVKKTSKRSKLKELVSSDDNLSPLQSKKTTLSLDESFISGHSGTEPLKPKKTLRLGALKESISSDDENAKPLQPKKTKRRVKTEKISSDNADIKPKSSNQQALPKEAFSSDDENTMPLPVKKTYRRVKTDKISSDNAGIKPKNTIEILKPIIPSDDENSKPLKPRKTKRRVKTEQILSDNAVIKPKSNIGRALPKETFSSDDENTKPLEPKKTKRRVKTEQILSDNADIKPKSNIGRALPKEAFSSDDENTKPLEPKKTKRLVKTKDKSDIIPLNPKKTTQRLKTEDIAHLKKCLHAEEKESNKSNFLEIKLLKPKKTTRCLTPDEPVLIGTVESQPLQPKKTSRRVIPKEPNLTDHSETKPLQARRIRCEVSKDLQPKKTVHCARRVKIPEAENTDAVKNVFDFSPNVTPNTTKASGTRGRKKNTTSKVVKPGITRQPKLKEEIEVGRNTITDFSNSSPQTKIDLAEVSTYEERSDNSFSLPCPVFDSPLVKFYIDSSFDSTPPCGKELNFSGLSAPADVSLNSSIELTRAGSDEETVTKTTRGRRTGRKVSVKDGEEKELPRASRVTDYTQKMKLNLPKSRILDSSITPVDVKRKGADHKSGSVSVLPSVESITESLECLIEKLGPFPPLFVYQQLCHHLAQHAINFSPTKAAFYLAESMSVTLRHRKHAHIARQHKQLQKAGLRDKSTSVSPDTSCRFGPDTDIVTKTVNKLPRDWTVCMISVLDKGCGLSDLVITRLQKGCQPIVKPVASFNAHQMQSVLSQFCDVMEASKQSLKLTCKTEWWQTRKQLNSNLQDMLERLETEVLQGWKCLLSGQLDVVDTDLPSTLQNHQLIAAIQQVSAGLSDKHLAEMLTCVTDTAPDSNVISSIRQSNQHITEDTPRKPVLLILDKLVQHLPWENIPVLRGQPVSRVTSLHHLYDQLVIEEGRVQSAIREGIDTSSTYYCLNPDNNLPATQQSFQEMFEKQAGWNGVTGIPPTKTQFTSALTDHQLLVYCGHGSGSRFLHGDDLQYVDCKATVLLIGCSSGTLQVKGQLEPVGMMHNYALAGCPCVVGNLWDVTDKDIDRLTETLLNSWLTDDKCKSLAEVLAKSRTSCRLSYLIGCAPVMYGLPVQRR